MVRESLPHCRSTNSQRKQHLFSELLYLLNFLYLVSLLSLAHSSTLLSLFCNFQSFVFNALRTLCAKHPGGMVSPLSLNPIHEDQNDTKPSQFRFHSRALPASHLHRSPMPLRRGRAG